MRKEFIQKKVLRTPSVMFLHDVKAEAEKIGATTKEGKAMGVWMLYRHQCGGSWSHNIDPGGYLGRAVSILRAIDFNRNKYPRSKFLNRHYVGFLLRYAAVDVLREEDKSDSLGLHKYLKIEWSSDRTVYYQRLRKAIMELPSDLNKKIMKQWEEKKEKEWNVFKDRHRRVYKSRRRYVKEALDILRKDVKRVFKPTYTGWRSDVDKYAALFDKWTSDDAFTTILLLRHMK